MAARDGSFRDGVYHFECEACGEPTTARRSHARTCSPACAARLRRSEQAAAQDPVNHGGPMSFYVSMRKLRAHLDQLSDTEARSVDLVVGVRRPGERPELGTLTIAIAEGREGGLVCTVGAPYSPFDEVSPEAQGAGRGA